MSNHSISLCGEELLLLAEKALFWPSKSALLVSDIHLGKVSHFRKAGIAVPMNASISNYTVLQDIILQYSPSDLYILGDLFHSVYNQDWERFKEFISQFSSVSSHLILGNHDILSSQEYDSTILKIYQEPIAVGPFMLSHHPIEKHTSDDYNLCGHIHPCILLKGPSRQKLRLPCFHFGEKHGVLPAFGSFTGTHAMRITKKDLIYAIADGQVIKIEQ